jgi:hypothetical protein
MTLNETTKIRLVGLAIMILFIVWAISKIDFTNWFSTYLGILISFGLSSICIYVLCLMIIKDHKKKIAAIEKYFEIPTILSLYGTFLLPIIFFNKLIYNITLRIVNQTSVDTTFYYFFVLILLLLNRYFVEFFNKIIFKYWHDDSFSLYHTNKIINKTSVQQFIYFGIAILLLVAQIDKGLYNVFSKELSEIFIPATVTFIAIERALRSVKVE